MDMNTTKCSLSHLKTACGLAASYNTPLRVMKLAEVVTDFLVSVSRDVKKTQELGQEILSIPVVEFVGASESDADEFESIEGRIKDVVEILKVLHNTAIQDQELNGHHEDMVISAFNDVIGAYCDLYNTTVDIRWKIMERLADDDEVMEGVFSSASELVSALRK